MKKRPAVRVHGQGTPHYRNGHEVGTGAQTSVLAGSEDLCKEFVNSGERSGITVPRFQLLPEFRFECLKRVQYWILDDVCGVAVTDRGGDRVRPTHEENRVFAVPELVKIPLPGWQGSASQNPAQQRASR